MRISDWSSDVCSFDLRIEPRGAVYVDHFGAYSLQRIGGKVLHRRRTPVETGPLAAGPAHPAELDAERQLVAVEGLQRLADQHLVVAHSIEVAGVEQGDHELDGQQIRRASFRERVGPHVSYLGVAGHLKKKKL